jgi:molecular chaperone DnaK (HSP70)
MIIGIDLGTTNSVVYTYENGTPNVVNVYEQITTPSVVGWHPISKEMIVGSNAKKRVMIHPETVIVSNKKNMGRVDFSYDILGNKYTPIQITSLLLRYLVDGAASSLNSKIESVVITVPAYFNSRQREETKQAAEMAGLKLLGLLDEPTAAAIAYGLDKGKDQTILVYDLGGGTFDISILKIENNHFKEIGKGGDVDLGGDDFDGAIMDYLYKLIKNESGIDLKNGNETKHKTSRQKLKEVAEEIKISLSSSISSDLYIPNLVDEYSLETTLSQDIYRGLILPFMNRTIEILRETIRLSDITVDDINRVICVGGSTKSPIVRDLLTQEVKRPFMAPNVDEIVAEGASIYAASLSKFWD